MEIYSSTTRFALACNQSTKIIEPIQSRCAVLRYTKLQDAEVSIPLIPSFISLFHYFVLFIFIFITFILDIITSSRNLFS